MTADLLYTDVEDGLRASVRSLLEKRASWDHVLARTECEATTDLELWHALSTEVGCLTLVVPEEVGGAGATWREVAVVAEELGRSVAPVPYLGSSGIATALLLALDDSALLMRMAAEATVVAVVVPFSAMPGTGGRSVELRAGRLYGNVRAVADAAAAEVLLVPTENAVIQIADDAAGVMRTPIVSLDMTRPLLNISFDGAEAVEVFRRDHVPSAVDDALRIGVVLLASEQLGVAERCLDMTLRHVKMRYQFGRPIGSFQAIKHRLADLWVLITQARAAARYAANCAAVGSPDLSTAAAVAKAHCSVVAERAAEECLQLHGGLGFTWEHPAHLFLKRAKSSAIALGVAERHRAALADLANIPPPITT